MKFIAGCLLLVFFFFLGGGLQAEQQRKPPVAGPPKGDTRNMKPGFSGLRIFFEGFPNMGRLHVCLLWCLKAGFIPTPHFYALVPSAPPLSSPTPLHALVPHASHAKVLAACEGGGFGGVLLVFRGSVVFLVACPSVVAVVCLLIMIWLWFWCCGVPVVFVVVFRWCPGGVLLVFVVVFSCRFGGVSRLVFWRCPGGVPVP